MIRSLALPRMLLSF